MITVALGLSLIGAMVILMCCVAMRSQSKEYRIITVDNKEVIITGQVLNDLIIEEINAGGENNVNYSEFLAKHKVI